MSLPPRFQSLPRHGLFVALFNVGIAIMLAAAHVGGDFVSNLVYSECIGLIGWLLIDVPRRLLWGDGRPPLAPLVALSAVAGVTCSLGGTWLASSLLGEPWPWTAGRGAMTLLVSMVAMSFAITYFWQRGKAAHLEAAMAQEKARAETVGRQMVEAKLRLLQAQIEPHFLFNTLANVHALIPQDAARAQEMLAHLDGFLRAALDVARKEHSTLADEFVLLRSYLEILKIRMGSRLEFSLELPDLLSKTPLPPMLLQPLVENALKHGLEPKIEGGRVDVSAQEKENFIYIRVSDTGLGSGNAPADGGGIGLAHVRERLAATYGDSASLDMQSNPSGGMTATVKIPAGK